jgi:hypothetical protein
MECFNDGQHEKVARTHARVVMLISAQLLDDLRGQYTSSFIWAE